MTGSQYLKKDIQFHMYIIFKSMFYIYLTSIIILLSYNHHH